MRTCLKKYDGEQAEKDTNTHLTPTCMWAHVSMHPCTHTYVVHTWKRHYALHKHPQLSDIMHVDPLLILELGPTLVRDPALQSRLHHLLAITNL